MKKGQLSQGISGAGNEVLGERPAVAEVAKASLERLAQVAGEKVFTTTPLNHAKDAFSEKQARDGILGLIFCVRQLGRKQELPPREAANVRARLLETLEDLFSDNEVAVWQPRGYYLLVDQLRRSGKSRNFILASRLLRTSMSTRITVVEPIDVNPHAFVDVMLSLAEELGACHDESHHPRVVDAATLLTQTYNNLFSGMRQYLDQWCSEELGKKDRRRYRRVWQQLAQDLSLVCLYRRLAHCWLSFTHLYLSESVFNNVPAGSEHLEHAFKVVAQGTGSL